MTNTPSPTFGDYLRSGWATLRLGAVGAWERAIYTGNAALADSLWRRGVRANGVDDWTLFQAFDCHHDDILIKALERGANPNANHRNNYGDYLLQRAAVQGNVEVVDALMAAGADSSLRCHNAYDALGAVAQGWGERVADFDSRKACARALLKNGADARALQGKHPHSLVAADQMDLEWVDMMLGVGAPAQWDSDRWGRDEHGVETLETYPTNVFIELFAQSAQRLTSTLSPFALRQWLHVASKHNALACWTTQTSHILFSLLEDNFEEYNSVLKTHNLPPLDAVDENGNSAWHAIFDDIATTTRTYNQVEYLMNTAKHLLLVPNHDGLAPRDVLAATRARLSSGRGWEEALQEMDERVFQRSLLTTAVETVDQPRPARRLKL